MDNILLILFFASFAYFSIKRLRTYLQFFQQEEYDSKRFILWIYQNIVIDKKISCLLLVIIIANTIFSINEWLWVASAGLLLVAFQEKNPCKTAKKKLVLTFRAKRILITAIFIALLLPLNSYVFNNPIGLLIVVQLIPFCLVLANIIWQPYEEIVKKRYWQEAHDKLAKLSPFVIGITGSFGKTSVKHILGHILELHAPTLFSKGSINTPMGNTRCIREELTKNHRYMVVEMGAYGKGSIDALCELTPPNMAVITSIGAAHYERFKSLETVANAKFELAEAAIKKDKSSTIITHQDVLRFDTTKQFAEKHPDNMLVCGESFKIEETKQTETGLEVNISWESKTYKLKVPLFGKHHGENIALSFAAACKLGFPIKTVCDALKSIPQIPHRLEVKPQSNGSILIDDAYNSNPVGFSSALDLLDMLGKHHNGRRILITPGMVELGNVHEQEHQKIAKQAITTTDIVIAVIPKNIPSFVETYKKGKNKEQEIIEVDTFNEAQEWMQNNLQKNDVILLENDLPDLYENKNLLL